jgi:hypothetical protein
MHQEPATRRIANLLEAIKLPPDMCFSLWRGEIGKKSQSIPLKKKTF